MVSYVSRMGKHFIENAEHSDEIFNEAIKFLRRNNGVEIRGKNTANVYKTLESCKFQRLDSIHIQRCMHIHIYIYIYTQSHMVTLM